MKRWLALAALAVALIGLAPAPAAAQNVICATMPVGDSTNACASTEFVQQNGNSTGVPVTAYGAKCDGVTNDTAAFAAALAGNTDVAFRGVCIANVTMLSNRSLCGSSTYGAVLQGTSTASPVISFADGISNSRLCNMTVQHAGTPVAGGHGIFLVGINQNITIDNVNLQNNFDGIQTQSSDQSWIRHVIINNSVRFGLNASTRSDYGAAQWHLLDILVTNSGNCGFNFQSNSGTNTGMILGQHIALKSFANGGGGICLLGSPGHGVYDFQLSNSFLGADGGNAEIYDDGYGQNHTIVNTDIELHGRAATGPGGTTPATNTGPGVSVTANQSDFTIIGGKVMDNSEDGIDTAAGIAIIKGVQVWNNGRAATANRVGIHVTAGTAIIQGNQSTNVSSTAQTYGLQVDADNNIISGNNFAGNATGPFNKTVTMTSSRIFSNDSTMDAFENIPSGAQMLGSLLATAIVAPGTPAAGLGSVYVDSTSKNLSVKDDAGVIKHGVQTKASVGSNWLTAIADNGAVSASQPNFTDLAGSIAIGQIPNSLITYAKIQNVAASRLLGNPTGSPAAPSEISLGATLTFSGTALQTLALTGDVTASANSFATTVAKIQGVTVSGITGSGGVLVMATGPALVTPSLGAATATTFQIGPVAPAANVVFQTNIAAATGRFFSWSNNNGEGQAGIDASGGVTFASISGASTIFGSINNVNADFYANNINSMTLVAAASLALSQVRVKSTQASTSTTTGGLRVDGGAGVAGAIYGGAEITTGVTVVGSLPTCNAAHKGAHFFVTDSNAASYTAGIGAVVATGGTTNVPVTCDGTNWRIG